MRRELFALFAAAALLLGMSACTTVDNPSSGGGNAQEEPVVAPAQLKQGIWTEYDDALINSGQYTEEQLAQMPAVAMWIEGDKGYFFTYTAEDVSEAVEGQISYNNKTGKGTITFPAIKDNPLSNQTVSFSMTTDETMEFDYTYEGQKITGTCTWLCENLDNWSSDITDEDWLVLMADYQLIPETAGPDASIDWSSSEVADLDEPLVWNDDIAATRAGTRAIGIGTVVSMGLKLLGALFEEEKEDPNKKINDKLDNITGKLDQALLNQEKMMNQMNLRFDQIDDHFKKVNERLNEISDKIDKSDATKIFNDRNEKYYNPLKVQNNSYFNSAYKLYNDNKSDLSKVSAKLGEYGKEWVSSNEEYLKLTWQYIEYLSSVQHTKYGAGMAKIYDGLTFDKYPWEHMGTGDRQNYRAYDMFMITRCLYMIFLYATYNDLTETKKEGIYNNYDFYKDKFKEFCEFKVTNPDVFRVCQIPGAHFVMHKELQKYNYNHGSEFGQCPDPKYFGSDIAYNPKWREKGEVEIDNPKELKSKLITRDEADAIFKYYAPNNEEIWWTSMIVNGNTAGGADYAQAPSYDEQCLILYDPQNRNNNNGMHRGGAAFNQIELGPVMRIPNINWRVQMGYVYDWGGRSKWDIYNNIDYYAAIVENRY